MNTPPVVNSGTQTANENTEVLLRSSVSDDFAQIQSYSWEQLEGRPVVLKDADMEVARFDAPEISVPESPLELVFQLTVTDNFQDSGAGQVTVLVQAVNALPLAAADAGDALEGGEAIVDVLSNDTDPDGEVDSTSVEVASVPANGNAVVNGDGSITYRHDGSETLEDRFTYTVRDDETSTSAPAEVLIRIQPVNDAPVSIEDLAATNEDQPVSIDVLANDTDVDSEIDPGSITISSPPTQGGAALVDGAVTYTPAANFFGEDSFTYMVSDLQGATSAPARVTVTVVPVNDPPVARSDSATTNEDQSVDIQVLGNDSDPDSAIDSSTVTIDRAPANGVAIARSSGVVTYTPKKDFFGTDTFTYRVSDVEGLVSGSATVTVTVKEINSPPTAVDDQATVAEDGSVTIDVVANDSDVDGNLNRGSAAIASPPVHGTAVLNGGKVTYTPEPNFNGEDSFTYTVADTRGRRSAPATVRVQVTPVNDAPVAVNDGPVVVNPNFPKQVDILGNDTDPDGFADIERIQVVTPAQHGTTSAFFSDGRQILVYRSSFGYQGPDSMSYRVVDQSGVASANVATVQFQVGFFGFGDDDVSASLSNSCQIVTRQGEVFEGTLRQPTDPADARYIIDVGGEKGVAVVTDPVSGKFTYTPNERGRRGLDSFTFVVESAIAGSDTRSASVLIRQHIMPLGDGITLGRTAWVTAPGAASQWTGYRGELQELLAGSGYLVDFVGGDVSGTAIPEFDPHHEGHDGFTSYQIAYGTGAGGVYAWLDANPADVVLLHAGTIELNESVAGIASVLDEIDRWEASPEGNPVTVYVARIIDRDPPHPETPAFNANLEDLVTRRSQDPLNPAYPDDVRIVDLYSLLNYPGDIAEGIFPTPQGYARMAGGWSEALSAGGPLQACR